MDRHKISMVSAGALVALTSTAWAGPMPVASEKDITPPKQTTQVHYARPRYRWHRGRHRHGYYRSPCYPRYAYRYPGYYDGWEPAGVAGALGLPLLPFAAASGWPNYGYPYRYPYYYW